MTNTEQLAIEHSRNARKQQVMDVLGFFVFLLLMAGIFWFFAPEEVRQTLYSIMFDSENSRLASTSLK